MTRLDAGPEELQSATACDGPRALVLEAREVPLGGLRGMQVHRLLPQRELPMIGAWCFLDRFGPQEATMRVEPHPHIGLQTVTWPYVGEVWHRDAIGNDEVIERGTLNLMTSGDGISHSEYSPGDAPIPLDALQLWVALPDGARTGENGFERHTDLPRVELTDASGREASVLTVVLGDYDGVRSPARAYTPLVGAELALAAGADVRLALRPEWEYALVAVYGDAEAAAGEDGTPAAVSDAHLLYLGIGRSELSLRSPEGATLFLLGGEPFDDEIVMWWNFVGRSHEEIVRAREDWEAGAARFGHVDGHGDTRVPAPPLPHVRLTPRRRRV